MVHLGNNIARIRSFRRMPQKDMAARLNMTQQDYSRLENKEEIEDELLNVIAEILDLPAEVIKNIDSTASIQTVYQQSGNTGNGFYIDANAKVAEMYERLLSEKDEVISMQKEIIAMYKKQQQAS